MLYRRWPDSRALLRDTLVGIARSAIPHEDTGSYRGDMLALLRGWTLLFTGPGAAVLRGVVAASLQDEQLAEALRTHVIGYRKEEMSALLARGIDLLRDEDREAARLLANDQR